MGWERLLQGLLPYPHPRTGGRDGGCGINIPRKSKFKAHTRKVMIPVGTKQGFPDRGQGTRACCV